MNKSLAEKLWATIIAYANACEEWGNEGNSGEFHDAKEEKRLATAKVEREYFLIATFSVATGWEPVDATDKHGVVTWTLREAKDGVI